MAERCPDYLPGGLAAGRCPQEFDPKQLEMGIKVEMEHVTGGPWSKSQARNLARDVAMDHLAEDPVYYTKLATIHREPGYRPNRGGRPRVVDALELAADLRHTFQGRRPTKVVELPFSWPSVLQNVGDSLAVAYESDKWRDDGRLTAYKHLAESRNRALVVPGLVHRWDEPAVSWPVIGPRVSLAGVPMPKHFAMLGLFEEADLRLYVAGDERAPRFGGRRDDGCVKLTVKHGLVGASAIRWPQRDQLFIFVYTEQDGVLMIVVGKQLGVERDGIVG